MRSLTTRASHRLLICLACLICSISLLAQSRAAEESRREGWQKVDQIFAALGIRPGAVVADVGSGDGFFTTRLARAVGANGRVFAVDISDEAIGRLRRRLEEDSVTNVTIVKGDPGDPKLPVATLDAALIVNAYHEMEQHQQILSALRRALKPDGRLVIVEPVHPSRRGRPRADQARNHEIDPEYVLQDARAAGFSIVALQDPFARRDRDIEWLMTLQPGDTPAATTAVPETRGDADENLDGPSLRISFDEFVRLKSSGGVTIVDVRGDESFAAGHVPGAISIPLPAIETGVEQLRRLGKPVVTYCS